MTFDINMRMEQWDVASKMHGRSETKTERILKSEEPESPEKKQFEDTKLEGFEPETEQYANLNRPYMLRIMEALREPLDTENMSEWSPSGIKDFVDDKWTDTMIYPGVGVMNKPLYDRAAGLQGEDRAEFLRNLAWLGQSLLLSNDTIKDRAQPVGFNSEIADEYRRRQASKRI